MIADISLFLTLHKLLAEIAKFSSRPFCQIVFQPRTVLLLIFDLDLFKVPGLPVESHQPANKQFSAVF